VTPASSARARRARGGPVRSRMPSALRPMLGGQARCVARHGAGKLPVPESPPRLQAIRSFAASQSNACWLVLNERSFQVSRKAWVGVVGFEMLALAVSGILSDWNWVVIGMVFLVASICAWLIYPKDETSGGERRRRLTMQSTPTSTGDSPEPTSERVFIRVRDELRDSEVTDNGVAHGTDLLTAPKVIGSKIQRNFERDPGE
jgi:hypothetical protein